MFQRPAALIAWLSGLVVNVTESSGLEFDTSEAAQVHLVGKIRG